MNARVFIPVDKATFYRFIAREPEERYEFERGRIVQQMAGGTRNHFKIAGRIRTLLEQQLDPAKWEALHERGVETADSVRFADVVVELASEPGTSVSTLRPSVIVEVLSPSSLDRDLDRKPSEYLSLATLEAYIVASQTEAACLVWLRGADRGFPDAPREYAAGDVIGIVSLNVALSIDDIYRGIALVPDCLN